MIYYTAISNRNWCQNKQKYICDIETRLRVETGKMVRKLLKAEKMQGNGVPVVTWKTVPTEHLGLRKGISRQNVENVSDYSELARFQVEFRGTIKVLE